MTTTNGAVSFAKTKTGIRCMGEHHWAEGETIAEAERNYRGFDMRKRFLTQQQTLLNSLFRRAELVG